MTVPRGTKKKPDEAGAFLANRQRAYLSTFDPKNQHAKQVLSDLAKFCKANETAFHPDPRVHALIEGRREVWLRIQNHLNMDTETLIELFTRRGA